MSFFSGSGKPRGKRNIRPKIVHSVSDSEAEDQGTEIETHQVQFTTPSLGSVGKKVRSYIVADFSLPWQWLVHNAPSGIHP